MERIYVRKPLIDRFWRFVVKGPGCWAWTSAKTTFGYGLINEGGRGGKTLRAHRLSWELHNGPIPDGLCVLHLCDNPECTRPDHLWLGTRHENILDASKKGRASGGSPAGYNHPRAKLSDQDILNIREEYVRGSTTLDSIAARYNVERTSVWRIVYYKTRI